MTRRTSAQAFADAASAMTRDGHVGDILDQLVRDCAEVIDASAVALLVTDQRGRLSLLASSSAAASHLEMLQIQEEQGPCVDAIRTHAVVAGDGRDELAQRWGATGRAILDAGFTSVEAHPLVWRGRVLGGLNVFRADSPPAGATADITRAFTDVAGIVLVHYSDVPPDQVTARVHEAVMARSTIEQAKGVISHLEDLDMEGAARRLQEIARLEGLSLTDAANDVIRRAHASS